MFDTSFQLMQGHWFNKQEMKQLSFVINMVMRCLLTYWQDGINPIVLPGFHLSDYVISFYMLINLYVAGLLTNHKFILNMLT